MVSIASSDGKEFNAYLAEPARGRGPGVVLIQEIFGVNAGMRKLTDDLARQGFVVACPDLFWRQAPGVELTDQSDAEWQRAFELYEGFDQDRGVTDIASTIAFLRQHAACTGVVGCVGYCLGGNLAYLAACRTDVDCSVGYYGVSIEKTLNEAERITRPIMLHIAGKDQFCNTEARAAIHAALDANPQVTIHDYPEMDHAFTRVGGEHYDADCAELANLRSREFLSDHLGLSGSMASRFAELWAEHVKYEFETHDVDDTLETMVEDAYVNHIPTLTGGVGKKQLYEFYSKRFIPQMPPDTEMTAVSRTIGSDRLIDEMIFKFTHTIEMDWMLPGVKPTGKRVEVPLVAIVHFREDKLAHEHIYWDQASVLVQLGLLDPTNLPVMGIETARKVLDNQMPSNALIERADRSKRQH